MVEKHEFDKNASEASQNPVTTEFYPSWNITKTLNYRIEQKKWR